MEVGLVSRFKACVVPRGRLRRRVKAGAFRGIKMNLDLSHESQMYLGLAEREIQTALVAFSCGVRTAIDVGAAFGEYALFFLLKSTARRVFAIDPDPAMQKYLYDNLTLNGLSADGRFRFLGDRVSDADSAETITLDALIPQIEAPCLVKVDVDGDELAVLRGARRLLSADGVRWIMETHSKRLETDCIVIFRAAGYQTTIVSNAWWRTIVPEQRPVEQNRWLLAAKKSVAQYSFSDQTH